MTASRDIVLFESNERVDLPDFRALQRNARSSIRAQWNTFGFGLDTAAADQRRILANFDVAEAGPPDDTVIVSRGTLIGAEVIEDGSAEFGVVGGLEGPAQRIVSLTALPVAVYNLYVRFVQIPGSSGNRVFWDDNASAEDSDTIATRKLTTWEALLAPGAAPSDDYILVATINWNGATATTGDITKVPHLFFEGNAGAAYAFEWGDGPNDRDADRATYGIQDHHTWVQAVRRQIEEIIGAGQKWYEVPTVSLGDHVNTNLNPHGNLLQQSNLQVESLLVLDVVPGGSTFLYVDAIDFQYTGDNFVAVVDEQVIIDNSAGPGFGRIDVTVNDVVHLTSSSAGGSPMRLTATGAGSDVLLESLLGSVNLDANQDMNLIGNQSIILDASNNIELTAANNVFMSGNQIVGNAFSVIDFTGSAIDLDVLFPESTDMDFGGGLSSISNLGQLSLHTGSIWDGSVFSVNSGFIQIGDAASLINARPDNFAYNAALARDRSYSGRMLYIDIGDEANANQASTYVELNSTVATVGLALDLSDIPHGATINTVRVYYNRVSAGTSDVAVAVIQTTQTTGAISSFGSATDAGGPAGNQILTGNPLLTVDHVTNSYQLNVVMIGGGAPGAANIRIYGVRVSYQMGGLGTSL